ncbi:flippase-like domain-containing protein [Actinospica durhamensis]|uniref:Flippase-like domain-containing protein n=1 Tax=Actinospica durhamensis TaxID=1508375 RepID=A0A941ISX2_9ACTN|nr:lysylphosphatidylglycerol synthase transmembrane domain-containing protein [Actinospica durhamensis]MBR7833711.1 flippase-like domain-containing protein [Actinospica durhamensis]
MPEPRTTEAPVSAPATPDDASPDAPTQGGRGLLGRVMHALESRSFKIGFVVLMVALGVLTVVREWSGFKTGLDSIGIMAGFEALLCVLVGLALNLQVWRGLLAAAGSRLSVRAGSRVFFIGQLGKYLPGSVWPVLTQMELGRAYKVPRERSASIAIVTMTIGLASGLLATLVGIPFMDSGKTGTYWWAFLFIPVLLVVLHPRVLNPILERGLRLIGRPAPEQPLTLRATASAIGVNMLAWVANGVQIWVMAVRLGAHGGHTLLASIGVYAFAWCVGFLIVIAPAGAGVREPILVATLQPMVHSYTAALAITLVSRLVTILGDLIGAALAGAFGLRTATAAAVGAAAEDPVAAGE